MSISNLTVPNNFNLFCNSLVTTTAVSSSVRPPVSSVSGLCVATTLTNADTPNGTAQGTVAEQSLQIFFNEINGICYLWKSGTSGNFPDAGQIASVGTNLAGAERLYILARSSTPTGGDGGGIYIPAGTFPLCESNLSDKVYEGMCRMNMPLKQDSETPAGTSNVPVLLNLHTENPNGQYFEIIIPSSYDYISNGDAGITATVDTLPGATDPNKPLNSGSQQIRYVPQKFSGSTVNGQQNSIPPFYIQYPIASD